MGRPLDLGGPRHRVLLATLLLSANQWVSADTLIESLWEGSSGKRVAGLHVRISELRGRLRDHGGRAVPISTRGSSYRLDVDPEHFDVDQFTQRCHLGRHALSTRSSAEAASTLGTARGLWRGPPYLEIADRPLAIPEVARLDAMHLQLYEDLFELELDQGHHADVATDLAALVSQHPLRERLWELLMLAQYRAGLQAEALDTYRRVRQELGGRLGVEPGPRLQELQVAILRHEVPHPAVAPTTSGLRFGSSGNLPRPISTFVGRGAELDQITQLMSYSRLITVTGVGGVGKTRLVIEAAQLSSTRFEDGTWWVSLSELTSADQIDRVLADIIHVSERVEHQLRDDIVEACREASALFVFDNCEHLLEPATKLIGQLVSACPNIVVVATSRQRLGIDGERAVPLAGLDLGENNHRAERNLTDAVRMFVDRASAIDANFRLQPGDIDVAADIVWELDGLPLAIELAAAQTSLLPLTQISELLHRQVLPFDYPHHLNKPARHQNLRAAIEWSYDLLTGEEQRFFTRAAVFSSGFTLSSLQAVSRDTESAAASLLWRLVERSLIARDPNLARARYRLLETIRTFGLDHLARQPDEMEIRRRHAEHFRDLAHRLSPSLRTAGQTDALETLHTEHANMRAALAHLIATGDLASAALLAAALYPYWDLHGHYREGRTWLEQILQLDAESPTHIDRAVRGRCLMGVATLATIQGDAVEGAAAAMEAYTVAAETDDVAGLAHAQHYLGLGALLTHDPDTAQVLLAESLANSRLAQDSWLIGWSFIMLGSAALGAHDYQAAAVCGAEASRELGADGDPEGLAFSELINGAAQFGAGGQTPRAAAHLQRALSGFGRLNGAWGLSLSLLMSGLALAAGKETQSLQLFAAAEKLRTSAGAGVFPYVERWLSACQAHIESVLTPEEVRAALETGREWPQSTAEQAAGRHLEELIRGGDTATLLHRSGGISP